MSDRPSVPLPLYGFGLFITAAICLMATSLGTDYWIRVEDKDHEDIGHGGLFKWCLDMGNMNNCTSYGDFDVLGKRVGNAKYRDIKTVRGLCIAGFVTYILSLVVLGHLVFMAKLQVKSRNHGWIALFVCGLGGLLSGSGSILFSSKVGWDWMSDIHWEVDYSLYLAAFSGAAAALAGMLFLIASFYLCRMSMPVMQPAVYPAMQVAPVAYVYPPGQQPQHPIMAGPQYNAWVQPQVQPYAQPLMTAGVPYQGQVADQQQTQKPKGDDPSNAPPPYTSS